MNKKLLILITIVILGIGGAAYYFKGGNLQGNLKNVTPSGASSGSNMSGDSESSSWYDEYNEGDDSAKSKVGTKVKVDGGISSISSSKNLMSIETDTSEYPGIFLTKTSTSEQSLGYFDITLEDYAENLSSCEITLQAYSNGDFYDLYSNEAGNPYSFVYKNFFKVVDKDAKTGKYLGDIDASDANYSKFGLSPNELGLSEDTTYELELRGYADSSSDLGVDAADMDAYDANMGEIYLTELSCSYKMDSGWEYYTWDKDDSEDENKYFDVDGAKDGMGLNLYYVIIGN